VYDDRQEFVVLLTRALNTVPRHREVEIDVSCNLARPSCFRIRLVESLQLNLQDMRQRVELEVVREVFLFLLAVLTCEGYSMARRSRLYH